MNPILLGPGVAPDVTLVNGWIYVAFGTQQPMALQLVMLTLDGTIVSQRTMPNGFDQSFPRFSGPWLVYRQDEAHGFAATAYNVLTGDLSMYGAAGGTFSLTVNAALGLMAYEWRTSGPWKIWLGGLVDGSRIETAMEGAPDGLDRLLGLDDVTLRKDTRGDVEGIWYPVDAGALTVGELRDDPSRPNGGIGARLWGDALRVALPAQNTPDPRCATDGTVYAIVCWNPVRLLLGTEAELRALPPVVTPVVPAPMPIPPVPPLPPEPPQPPPKPKPVPPKEPVVSLPSLDTWINVEYPQLVAAFTEAWGHGPDHQWAAFQTYRRYMEPDVWPFAVMLRHERSQNGHQPPVNPQ